VKLFTDSYHFPAGINQFVFNDALMASFDMLAQDTFMRFKMSEVGRKLIALLERLNVPS